LMRPLANDQSLIGAKKFVALKVNSIYRIVN